MAVTEFSQKILDMRLDKMRLGQAACEFVDIPSLDEVRVALVPLTEAEYMEALDSAELMLVNIDSPVGSIKLDRRSNQETLIRSARNPNNLDERVWNSVEDMMKVLNVTDVNHLTDLYMEMSARNSPSADSLDESELEEAKKVWELIDWNALSGPQWWALRRFLFNLGPKQLLDNSLGSGSMAWLTGQKSSKEPT